MKKILIHYKLVLLPLILVLVFDISLLAMNYYISSELEVSSININIAGRQRMLSQRMTKSLALIHYANSQNKPIDKDKKELKKAVQLFDQTFNAFYSGGKATSAAGDEIIVTRLSQTAIRKTLDDASVLWMPLQEELSQFYHAGLTLQSDTQRLIELLSVSNLQLLKLMNDLTNQLENDAKEKTYYLKGLQTIVVIMILLSFAMASVRLMRRENYYNNLMEKSTDIIIGIDIRNGNITFVSSSVNQLLGYDEEHYIGKSVLSFFTTSSKRIFSEILGNVAKNNFLENDRCEVELLKRDGDIVIADMVMQLTLSEDGKFEELSADIRDISERKMAELALSEMARKDELTGLPNRKLFKELSEHSILRAIRYKQNFAILFIDLDGFKAVNDTYGHQVGDKLLIHIAKLLVAAFRASDCVARIGGDEFFVLLEEMSSRREISKVGKKVIHLLSQPVELDGHTVQVGASIGVAIYPKDADDINKLIKKADKAMYAVKESGKNNIAFA